MLKKVLLPLNLSLSFLILSCSGNVSSTVDSSSKIQNTSVLDASTFENVPEEQNESVSISEKNDIESFFQNNGLLQGISVTSPENYKVRFTSDGGAVFVTKQENSLANEFTWKRTATKLLFDTLQPFAVKLENGKYNYYSRYSQLSTNQIKVENTGFSKEVNLVQSVALEMQKESSGYKLNALTPIVIREVKKDLMNYSIKNTLVNFSKNSLKELKLNEKSLIPWPGINYKKADNEKLYFNLDLNTTNDIKDIEILLSLNEWQVQMVKTEGAYTGEISTSYFKTGKNSIIIEVIDKNSLTSESEYHGYTWIIPFVVSE